MIRKQGISFSREGEEIEIHLEDLKKALLVLRAANHKFRQFLLELVKENQPVSVTELIIKTRQEQSVISQHLALLRKAGLVTTDRQGKSIFYSLDVERLKRVIQLAEELSR